MLDPAKVLAGARSRVHFNPHDLVRELMAYGESDAAEKLLLLDEQAIAAVGVLASRHYSGPDNPILDKAICLGIVEFLEGQGRPLKRNRRVYPKRDGASDA
ncbi:hypothetical protein [Pseudoxanthomonas spadix]|uniref:hypothetical protein n=1 Tax=Pseudoxanthomonas spadix TaxID=415229 RepID=UPI0011D1EBBA|nr:hypothetical protein [Pseudoxanthomonas spadix]